VPLAPLDVGRVDHALARTRRACLLDLLGVAVPDVPFDRDHPSLPIALDDLCDQQPPPDSQPLAAGPAGRERIPKCFSRGPHVGTQPICTDEDPPDQCAAPDAPHQLSNQREVARLAHLASEPEPRPDYQGHRHPEDLGLNFDAQLVSLNLAQAPGLLDQVFMDSLAVRSRSIEPVGHGALVKAEGGDNRLDRAAVREQCHHEGDGLSRGVKAVEGSAFVLGEGLATLLADEASLLLGMHADVALAGLSSGRTGQVRTECCCRVHAGSPLDRIDSSVKEDALWTRNFLHFNQLHG